MLDLKKLYSLSKIKLLMPRISIIKKSPKNFRMRINLIHSILIMIMIKARIKSLREAKSSAQKFIFSRLRPWTCKSRSKI